MEDEVADNLDSSGDDDDDFEGPMQFWGFTDTESEDSGWSDEEEEEDSDEYSFDSNSAGLFSSSDDDDDIDEIEEEAVGMLEGSNHFESQLHQHALAVVNDEVLVYHDMGQNMDNFNSQRLDDLIKARSKATKNELLQMAIKAGDIATMRQLIAESILECANPDKESTKDRLKINELIGIDNQLSFIHLALSRRAQKAVKILISHPEIDLNIRCGKRQMTPFHLACQQHFHFGIRILAKHPKVDINLPDKNGLTPIRILQSVRIVEFLISTGREIHLTYGKPIFAGKDRNEMEEYLKPIYDRSIRQKYKEYLMNPSMSIFKARLSFANKSTSGALLFGAFILLSDSYFRLVDKELLIAKIEEKKLEKEQLEKKESIDKKKKKKSIFRKKNKDIPVDSWNQKWYQAQINQKEREAKELTNGLQIIHFFEFATRLPLDLQMTLCNRAFRCPKEFVSVSDTNNGVMLFLTQFYAHPPNLNVTVQTVPKKKSRGACNIS